MRDLERARHAFKEASAVSAAYRKEYRSRAHGLGPAILRHGLAAAITFLEREGEQSAAHILLGHIAGAGLSGVNKISATQLPDAVRALEADAYVLATRETLRLCLWLRRAVQAWPDERDTSVDGGAHEPHP